MATHASATGIVALTCAGIGKVFPVLDTGNAWRLLLGSRLRGKQIVALNDVSMAVPKGKMVGVLGRNGAGKSTLLRILAGVYSATTGTIERRGNLSGLFELGGASNPMMPGREYATRVLLLQGLTRSALPDILEDIRQFSELEEYFDRPIYSYSSGMAARLYFAVATAVQHDIYLVDEILSVGDEHFQAKSWARIRDRLSQGASGVLVTHDWSSILKLCEISHILDRGRIIDSGPTDRIVRTYLNLTMPPASVARFADGNPECYTAQSRRDAEFRFTIDLAESVPVVLSYSIELLRLGFGWEIVLLGEDLPVAETAGRHGVTLSIPTLPLAPGHYYLNLFLSSPKGADMVKIGYDVRSWTYGNGISLEVYGTPRRSSILLPLTWERQRGASP